MAFKRVISAVDTHPGIPMRVITGGVGHIPGATVYDKMRWLEANDDPKADWKNAVTMATGPFSWHDSATWTGVLDRCPCGTGTCAKMAVPHAKGDPPLERDFRHQGILGTIFTGRLLESAKVGDKAAVVPTISGRSWIYGFNTLVLDPEDPLAYGYTMGDIWA